MLFFGFVPISVMFPQFQFWLNFNLILFHYAALENNFLNNKKNKI